MDFAVRHAARCPRPGWPDFDREPARAVDFFAPWVHEFDACRVLQADADLASADMARSNYDYPNSGKHLKQLMYFIRRVQDARARDRAAGGLDVKAISREVAAHASRNCPECGGGPGGGFTSRPISRDGRSYSCAFFCLCPHGEWLAYFTYTHNREIFNRMRRLAQYPELWNLDLMHPSWPTVPAMRDWAIEPDWIGVHAPLHVYHEQAF
jgi:hypothetical protein